MLAHLGHELTDKEANLHNHTSDFENAVSAVCLTVSYSTARVYRQTYRAWQEWAETYQFSPLDFSPLNLSAFISAQPVAHATRLRMLSALRTLAYSVSLQNAYLQGLKTPVDGEIIPARERRALSGDEVRAVLSVWNGETNHGCRNRALIALLLMTGLRRAEAAALTWADIDLESSVIAVRNGKGGIPYEVAIYGEIAHSALMAWNDDQPEGRVYVFCTVNKGDNLGPDVPMTPTSLYRVVKETEAQSGVAHFSPHDARRTVVTALLRSGEPIHEVQAQCGHKDGSTTLRYAMPGEAKRRAGNKIDFDA